MLYGKCKSLFSLLFTLCPLLMNGATISREIRGGSFIYTMDKWIEVPDGTLVSPFLNPNDSTNQEAWDFSAGFSLAGGNIASQSSIHIMPLVTQVVFVMDGCLEVNMKKPDSLFETHLLNGDQAIIIPPNTFLQLVNRAESKTKVLYMVSPAYVFLLNDDNTIEFDDSFIVKETWNELAQKKWIPEGLPSLDLLREKRQKAEEKIKEKKQLSMR